MKRLLFSPQMAWVGMLLCPLCVPIVASAQVTTEKWVTDGAGGRNTNALFQGLSAACQPGPTGETSSDRFRNSAGFLTSFLLAPELDSDSDDVADEDDPDDDNDALSDASELKGSGFSPTTATDPTQPDTDGDGATDGEESVAGTNPRDPASLLHIVAVKLLDGLAVVFWQSREGYEYELLCGATIDALATNPVVSETVTASGGTGPWQETESSATNVMGEATQFYNVKIKQ